MSDRPFLFRCDAGAEHGLGHLSRALVVARVLRATSASPIEFLVHAPETILARVTEAGFALDPAPASVGTAKGQAWLADRLSRASIRPVLVFDSKAVNAPLVAACATKAEIVCFNDEVAVDLDCRLIVNNHPWVQESDYGKRRGRLLLLGARYNTVDPAYFDVPPDRAGVLVSLGGEDPANHTTWLAEALGAQLRDVPVRAVLGPAHPDPVAARRALARHIPHAHIELAPVNLVATARACQIALSAGGTACYEFAAAGMAVGAVAVEPHQERLITELAKRGAVVRIAGPEKGDPAAARAFLAAMLADPAARRDLCAAARALFASSGAPLVAQALAAL
jgi:spore coat polysaccharide biosynthesis predicted glycosyltransferase SpsG